MHGIFICFYCYMYSVSDDRDDENKSSLMFHQIDDRLMNSALFNDTSE